LNREPLFLSGPAVEAHFEPLARLRIAVFREFPYLYAGDLDYEMNDLHVYARSPRSLVVLPGLTHTAFCAVDRTDDHPRRPESHRPLDAFWQRLGYEKQPDLRARFEWKDLGPV